MVRTPSLIIGIHTAGFSSRLPLLPAFYPLLLLCLSVLDALGPSSSSTLLSANHALMPLPVQSPNRRASGLHALIAASVSSSCQVLSVLLARRRSLCLLLH